MRRGFHGFQSKPGWPVADGSKFDPQSRARKRPGADVDAVMQGRPLIPPFAEAPAEGVPGVQVECRRFEQAVP